MRKFNVTFYNRDSEQKAVVEADTAISAILLFAKANTKLNPSQFFHNDSYGTREENAHTQFGAEGLTGIYARIAN